MRWIPLVITIVITFLTVFTIMKGDLGVAIVDLLGSVVWVYNTGWVWKEELGR